MSEKPIAAIDGDGVIFDFDAGYIDAWERAFGWRPTLVNPDAYTVMGKYGVPELNDKELAHFRSFMNDDFFRNLSFFDGVEDAIRKLAETHELYCVTAMPHDMKGARADALKHLPFSAVITTPAQPGFCRFTGVSPKAGAISDLGAVLFVDDYLPFHRHVSPSVLRVLLSRTNHHHPDDLKHVDEVHENFVKFVDSFTKM